MASSEASGSKKRLRSAADPEEAQPQKIVKVHPFFMKPSAVASAFRWISPSLGPKKTCLYGVNLVPKPSARVAAFDLDGTLIKAVKQSKGVNTEWEWWHAIVPKKLKEVHHAGYSVVVISNQNIKGKIDNWKKKISLIAAALDGIPFSIFAATERDFYRKPMPGMWVEMVKIFSQQNVSVELSNSFFVGDAAGRPGDFACTDRKWALNVGIPFHTPEEYFLGKPQAKFELPGFHVSSLIVLPMFSPTSTPLIPESPSTPEIVMFVGYPCLGKSTMYRRHFQPAGYVHVNQDTLGSRSKCVKAMEEALAAGKSCVIDNTNRDVKTRKHYLDIAKKLSVPARCIVFTGSLELAWHNNLYRAFNMTEETSTREPKREIVPYMAFTGFRNSYEEPSKDEGFVEIKRANWNFEGSEEERARWSMWLQIDGK